MTKLFCAWNRIHKIEGIKNNDLLFSIIIAVRNEGKNIKSLLESLYEQNYPKEQFEVIVIDDHSQDESQSLISRFIEDKPQLQIKYFKLEEGKAGKKTALQKAYSLAKNEIFVMTDGDIRVPTNWLKIIAEAFKKQEIKVILGGVKIESLNSFVGKFQGLEMLSLIASGAGAAELNQPIMSNGANMAFRKSILESIKFDKIKPEIASGDDVFLMLETKRIFGADSIRFVKDAEHFVTTKPVQSWKELINQRKRWVSKSGHYSDRFLLMSSWIVLLQNLVLIVLLISALFIPVLLKTLVLVWLAKFIFDFIFLRNICRFTSQNYLLKYYPLMALIYPFFISYTAIVGQFSHFSWKGRDY